MKNSMTKILIFAITLMLSLGTVQVNAQEPNNYINKIEELLKKERRSGVNLKSEITTREKYILLLEDQDINLENKSDFSKELANTKEQLEKIEGIKILSQYDELMIGFSVEIDSSKYAELEKISQIKKIRKSNIYEPAINNSKDISQVNNITRNNQRTGEGIVVSIIDTGIDASHKDLRLTNPEKAKLNSSSVDNIVGSGKLNSTKVEKPYKTAKIPFGYNYADDNNEYYNNSNKINDHGTHVSGIVGANGDKNEALQNKSVIGTAPETQLLAMKVFSNDPNNKGAQSDDIIQAIEDSVLLGANIINMSLGSVSGFQEDTDIEQLAIERASQKGVISVISAGNSSNASNTTQNAFSYDESTVGAPSTSSSAISVANMENNAITNSMLGINFKDKLKIYQYSSTGMQPVLEKQAIKYVNMGLISDYDPNEKYETVLIKRGSISFQEKYDNAIRYGAKQIIVFNSDNTGEQLISMKIDLKNSPALFVTNKSGNEILDSINNLEEPTMSPEPVEAEKVDNPRMGKMQISSSWGPTPNLSLKPEITAPGGNIYSTIANNKYASLSGTSMSAPHVSGAIALVYNEVKNSNNVYGKDLVELIKNLIMNSATPINENDKKVPVRKQGAGLLQMERMLAQKVLVTNENNKAAIEVGQIDSNSIQTKVNIRNIDTRTHKYNISKIELQESTNIKTKDNEVDENIINSSVENKIFDLNPNSQKMIELNIKFTPSSKDRFISGFIYLEDENKNQTTVPLICFYGDFGSQKIFPSMIWEKNNTNEYDQYKSGILKVRPTSYIGSTPVEYYNYNVNSKNIAVSSVNEPETYDRIDIRTSFMRNANSLEIKILNNQGNTVNKTIYNGLRKQLMSPEISSRKFSAWDGKINNEPAPEGKYKVKMTASTSIDKASKEELFFDITVDNKGPDIKLLQQITDNQNISFEWESVDNLDIRDNRFAINGELIKDDLGNEIRPEYDELKNTYKIKIDKAKIPEKYVAHAISYDAIYNYTIKELKNEKESQEQKKPTEYNQNNETKSEATNNIEKPSVFEITGNKNELILVASIITLTTALLLRKRRF
jgi:lactocepin